MMRRLTLAALAVAISSPVSAQLPPSGGITINTTPVTGGTTTNCLFITSTRKVGSQACGSGTAANVTVATTTITGGTASGILWNNAGVLAAGPTTTNAAGSVALPSAATVAWNADTILQRDGAANTLAMRNGTNPQFFNLYGTFTDASNYERLSIGLSGGIFQFNTTGAGTGSNRSVRFNIGGNVSDISTLGFSSVGYGYGGGRNNATLLDLGVTNVTSLTAANAQPLINLAQTWNTTGVPTLIKANVTNTASGAGSLLMDLQVGGVSKFSVSPVGTVTTAALSLASGGGITLSNGSFFSDTNNGVFLLRNNGNTAGVSLDVSTDAVAKFRNRANSADAAVTALSYTASGSAGVSCTVGTLNPATAIVVGGIITHC